MTEFYNEACEFLSVHHSPYGTAKKADEKRSSGCFLPPNYTFIPARIRQSNEFQIIWAFNYFHELLHMKSSQRSGIGTYLYVLDNFFKELLFLGISYFYEGELKKGEECLIDAFNINEIIDEISVISEACSEILPVYAPLNNNFKDANIDMFYDGIIVSFFGDKSITKEKLSNFWDRVKKYQITQLESDKVGKGITRQHLAGYNYGKRIIDNYNELGYLQLISDYCLNVDFYYNIDLSNVNVNEFKRGINNTPEKCLPEYILNQLLRLDLSGLLKTLEANLGSKQTSENILELYQKMAYYPNFNQETRTKYIHAFNQVKSDMEEYNRRYTEIINNLSTANASTTISRVKALTHHHYYIIHIEAGDLFLPIGGASSPLKETQKLLSEEYATQLVIQALGYRGFDDDIFQAIEQALNYLTTEVSNPYIFHNNVIALLENQRVKKAINSFLTKKGMS